MAVTSPDGLISPDATDPFNITADLAASMTSVQTALLNRANHVGTTTQRNAWDAKRGDLWWDTTESEAYIYNGSAWVALSYPDTGWVNVPMNGNAILESQSSRIRRVGHVVEYRAEGFTLRAAAGWQQGQAQVLVTTVNIPSEFRPTSRVTGVAVLSSSSFVRMLHVRYSGSNMQASPYDNPASESSSYDLSMTWTV